MISHKKGISASYIVGFLIGMLSGITATIALSGILAMLVVNGSIPMEMMAYGTFAIIFLSGVIAAAVTGCIIKNGWLISCVGAGGLYFISLLIMAIVLFDGVFRNVPLVLAMSIIGPCVLGLIGTFRKRKVGFRYRKHRFR